jgi:predicted enzyme related to lactoylglutathione lyase
MSANANANAQATSVPSAAPFVWYELMTTDLTAATQFYQAVLGWQADDAGMPFPYTLASTEGKQVAGLMTLPDDAAQNGAQPCWIGYVGVAHCDTAVEQAQAAGATLCHPPQDIPGVGRFATLLDPQGAAFIAFQDMGSQPPATTPPTTPGTVGWHELITADSEEALAWYGAQLGWTAADAVDMGEFGLYRMFNTGGAPAGGMMNRPPEMPVSAWLYYFNVDGIDSAIARLEAAGGRVCLGPHEVPGGSWIVNATDPQGVMFALVAPGR